MRKINPRGRWRRWYADNLPALLVESSANLRRGDKVYDAYVKKEIKLQLTISVSSFRFVFMLFIGV